ncbi:hypothetical protein MyNCGM121_13730 [Achromobacter xylosoxidans]
MAGRPGAMTGCGTAAGIASDPARRNRSGRKVVTTNRIPRQTVTA